MCSLLNLQLQVFECKMGLCLEALEPAKADIFMFSCMCIHVLTYTTSNVQAAWKGQCFLLLHSSKTMFTYGELASCMTLYILVDCVHVVIPRYRTVVKLSQGCTIMQFMHGC